MFLSQLKFQIFILCFTFLKYFSMANNKLTRHNTKKNQISFIYENDKSTKLNKNQDQKIKIFNLHSLHAEITWSKEIHKREGCGSTFSMLSRFHLPINIYENKLKVLTPSRKHPNFPWWTNIKNDEKPQIPIGVPNSQQPKF